MNENGLYLPLILIGLRSACARPAGADFVGECIRPEIGGSCEMTPRPFVAALLALAFFLGACESYSPSKGDIGMATGAVLGGVIGHQFGSGGGQAVATIGGAALGAFLGSRIGRKMDQNDQKNVAAALETSREGSATTWRNPDTGQTYSVTPTHTYPGSAGPCRHFRTVTQIDGLEEVVQGTACRQPDGTWKAA